MDNELELIDFTHMHTTNEFTGGYMGIARREQRNHATNRTTDKTNGTIQSNRSRTAATSKLTPSARQLRTLKRVQKRKRIRRLAFCAVAVGCILLGWSSLSQLTSFLTQDGSSSRNWKLLNGGSTGSGDGTSSHGDTDSPLDAETLSTYPDWLQEMAEKNPESMDFVQNYADRQDYIGKTITLTGAELAEDVPLLFQWDKRWGYDAYGEEAIGYAGCGPTCLSMVYIGLTGDSSMNPKAMSDFAYDHGFYTTSGTSWSLWTEGVQELGLSGRELSMDQSVMENALDDGGLIICSVGPGDFTTTGHFIVIRGYDKNGFYVNDPNHQATSSRQWTFDDLNGQVKCLWKISR